MALGGQLKGVLSCRWLAEKKLRVVSWLVFLYHLRRSFSLEDPGPFSPSIHSQKQECKTCKKEGERSGGQGSKLMQREKQHRRFTCYFCRRPYRRSLSLCLLHLCPCLFPCLCRPHLCPFLCPCHRPGSLKKKKQGRKDTHKSKCGCNYCSPLLHQPLLKNRLFSCIISDKDRSCTCIRGVALKKTPRYLAAVVVIALAGALARAGRRAAHVRNGGVAVRCCRRRRSSGLPFPSSLLLGANLRELIAAAHERVSGSQRRKKSKSACEEKPKE